MSPEIADLDRRIRACMSKHGITQDDLARARRYRKMADGLASLAEAMSGFGVALKSASDAISGAMEKAREGIAASLKNRHMRQMISDAVQGFDSPATARDALFAALMGQCDAKEAERYGNLMGRQAHEKARQEAAKAETKETICHV